MHTILGIVGTAGRKQAQNLMTPAYYNNMIETAKNIMKKHNITTLVSGGAAFSDHVAVSLYLRGDATKLYLMLPESYDIKSRSFKKGHYGNITNSLHHIFSEKCNVNSLDDIAIAIKNGAIIAGNDTPGFLTRNTWIAQKATHLLAFTSGMALNEKVSEIGITSEYPDSIIKDNGTRDTWRKSINKYRIVSSIPLLKKQENKNLLLL